MYFSFIFPTNEKVLSFFPFHLINFSFILDAFFIFFNQSESFEFFLFYLINFPYNCLNQWDHQLPITPSFIIYYLWLSIPSSCVQFLNSETYAIQFTDYLSEGLIGKPFTVQNSKAIWCLDLQLIFISMKFYQSLLI